MQHPKNDEEIVERASMSARARMTQAEVTRIAQASLSQMETQLDRWRAQLNALEANVPGPAGDVGSENRESIDDLNTKYRVACVRFDEFKVAGAARWGILKFRMQSAWSDFEITLQGMTSQVALADRPEERQSTIQGDVRDADVGGGRAASRNGNGR
jgi:hypothetical protein